MATTCFKQNLAYHKWELQNDSNILLLVSYRYPMLWVFIILHKWTSIEQCPPENIILNLFYCKKNPTHTKKFNLCLQNSN